MLPARQYPHQTKVLAAGAAYSIDPEILGSLEQGEYMDAENMRPNGLSGDYGALEKINGESIRYPSEDNTCVTPQYYFDNGLGVNIFDTGTWYCMGTCMVRRNVVEFWADQLGVLDPFIRINGVISCANANLPINFNFPLQFHWNHNCIGGEIYLTDNNTPPIIMNVGDMIDNNGTTVCTEKYFREFDIKAYQINLPLPAHHMRFWELTSSPAYPSDAIFGSGGMKVGQHAYSFRYVDSAGNRSNWLPITPLIPVPVQLNYADYWYPGVKTYGADPGTKSSYGIVLKFRVENFANFSYVEVKRYSFDQGTAVGYTPGAFLIGTVDVSYNEVSVKTIVDFGEVGEPITEEDDLLQFSTIEKAKSVRYFDNVLTLHNITYESKDVDVINLIPNLAGNEMFPVLQGMGKVAHDDPYFGTYNRSLRRGEIYGYGVGFFGAQMDQSLAKKVNNGVGYQMPDRRDEITVVDGNSQTFSYDGIPTATVIQGNSAQLCFEAFDLVDAVQKTNCCLFANISCNGRKSGGNCNGNCDVNSYQVASCQCNIVSVPYDASDAGYSPMTPTGDSDNDTTFHNERINLHVEAICPNGNVEYNPQAFAPNYYALGNALNGVDLSAAPWVQAFTILRTPPAGRVICQGMGFYYMISGDNSGNVPASKELDKFWFYSSEMAAWTGLMTQDTIDQISANANNRYSAQLISPVGFFSEMPWAENRTFGEDVSDMCVYPRFYKDDHTINTLPQATSTGTPYVEFGKWRNNVSPAWLPDLNNPAQILYRAKFPIASLRAANNNGGVPGSVGTEYVGTRGNEYFALELQYGVYANQTVGLNACDPAYDSGDCENFHEPMYYINIVDNEAAIPSTGITQYIDTGAYVKVHSLVTVSDGSGNPVPLIDERWEDCIPYPNPPFPPNTYTNIATTATNKINSIIELQSPSGVREYWLNADGVSDPTIAGMPTPFTIPGGSKAGTVISGFYRSSVQLINGKKRFYSLVFDVPGYVPTNNYKIYVNYDTEVPVQSYGGDTYIGDDVFAPIDRQIPNGGGAPQSQPNSEKPFYLNIGFPYYKYDINPRIYVLNKGSNSSNEIQECCEIKTAWIREMIALFNCESPIHLPYNYEGAKLDTYQNAKFFPNTNYIQRPASQWDINLPQNYCNSGGNVYDAYKNDYPGEDNIWRWGGYRWRPQYNIDYLHYNNLSNWTSKPPGYTEQTHYCTRVIWSLRRDIAVQDSPGLKTYLPQSHIDLEDSQGEIKFAWSALGGNKGNNLYSFCDRGICMLPTQNNILRDATSEQIAVIKTTNNTFLTADSEYWITREIGMNTEMWRSRAEYNDMLFFTNLTSAYLFADNQIEDIGANKYFAKLYDTLKYVNGEYYQPIATGSWITAFYDTKYKEYVVQLSYYDNPNERVAVNTFAYNLATKHWNGRYVMAYDQYLSFDNLSFGMGRKFDKDVPADTARTFMLDDPASFTLSGVDINAVVLIPFTPTEGNSMNADKEFVNFRVGSLYAPSEVQFFDNIEQVKLGLVQTNCLEINMRQRNGWEQGIGRRIIANAGTDNRMQGRSIIMAIIHDKPEPFNIKDVSINWRRLFVS